MANEPKNYQFLKYNFIKKNRNNISQITLKNEFFFLFNIANKFSKIFLRSKKATIDSMNIEKNLSSYLILKYFRKLNQFEFKNFSIRFITSP